MSLIPYQVDYSVKNTAKTLGFSKKKVTFSFGFANLRAIEDNLTGAACRGSEHQVTFIWSLKTGKRQLFIDGKEVHFSETGQNGWTTDRAWQHQFRLKDSAYPSGIKMHFVSQPVSREIPGSRPFDLRVLGVSYFNFNQIFQLGTPEMMVRSLPQTSHRSEDAYMSPEERKQIAQAKLESLKDLERQKQAHHSEPSASTATTAPAMNRNEGALISFDDDVPSPTPPVPAQAPITHVGSSGAYQQQFASSLTLDTAIDDSPHRPSSMYAPSPGTSYAPPQNYPTTGGYTANPYAPPPQQQQQYQQPPMYQQQAPMYQQQPPPQQQQPTQQPYGGGGGAMTTYQAPAGQPAPSPYAIPYSQQQDPYSTTPTSAYSYGSAPSFAQPPPANFAQPPPPRAYY